LQVGGWSWIIMKFASFQKTHIGDG
jgi:hypothetical protein